MRELEETTKTKLNEIFARWNGITMPRITLAEVEFLLKHNYAAHIYPRKKQVCVNGCKYYRLVK